MPRPIVPPSVQMGKPKLGECPKGWEKHSLGEVWREVSRPAKLEDEKEYQLVTAKRNRGGIVPRERLKGKKVLTKTQFFIEADDFLISKRQIVHGACGVVPKDLEGAIVSNEYAVLHPKNGADLTFLNYFSHSVYFQQTCYHASVGVTVEKMIFKLPQWYKFPIYLPPAPEQKKIAEILSCWDKVHGLANFGPRF